MCFITPPSPIPGCWTPSQGRWIAGALLPAAASRFVGFEAAFEGQFESKGNNVHEKPERPPITVGLSLGLMIRMKVIIVITRYWDVCVVCVWDVVFWSLFRGELKGPRTVPCLFKRSLPAVISEDRETHCQKVGLVLSY